MYYVQSKAHIRNEVSIVFFRFLYTAVKLALIVALEAVCASATTVRLLNSYSNQQPLTFELQPLVFESAAVDIVLLQSPPLIR